MTIDAERPDGRAGAGAPPPRPPDRSAVSTWAANLAEIVARDQPAQHVGVFVPDPPVGALRLMGQVWSGGEESPDVVVGEWTVPIEGSVCGRVFRTGAAALVADAALDPDFRRFPGSRSRSSLTVPVGPQGSVVAVINVEAPWTAAFTIRDYDHLTETAGQAFATYPQDGAG